MVFYVGRREPRGNFVPSLITLHCNKNTCLLKIKTKIPKKQYFRVEMKGIMGECATSEE